MNSCCCTGRIKPLQEERAGEHTPRNDEQALGNCEETLSNSICCCRRFPLWILPIISTVWNTFTIFLTFGIAVGKDHNEVEDIPYISHTAINAPQMYIFSQLINMGAVILLFIGIIRLLFVQKSLSSTQARIMICRWSCFNTFTFTVGLLCAIGFTLVANFPSNTASTGHNLGGVLGFGGGVGYCILQTLISYRIYREKESGYSKCVVIMQIMFSVVLACLLLILVALFLAINRLTNSSDNYTTSSEYKVSSIAEWSYIILLNIYMLTFIPEFRRIEFKSSLIDIHSK